MTTNRTTDDRRTDRSDTDTDIDRRTFIAAGGTVGATMLAGCASENESPNGDESDDEGTESESSFGDEANFRLLISDMPADIGDFERLDVTFDSARIFDGGGEADADEGDDEGDDGDEKSEDDGEATDVDAAESEDADEDDESTADGDENSGNDGDGDSDSDDDSGGDSDGESDDGVERRRDYYWLDLEGETVDLTEVVGDKAVSVFEGELSAGTYEKIELHVSHAEGDVDDETVDVKVPSEKLQITHAFEVSADDPLEFVFDINVVKRGKNNGYILKPVISESGVAGKDVDVERVDEGDESDEGDDDDGNEEGGADSSGDAADGAAGSDDGTEENASDTEGDGGAEADDSDGDDGDESGSNP